MPDDDRVYVFSCGSQYVDWLDNNCCGCRKQADPEASLDEMPCDIERALSWAAVDDGRIPLPVADRMGKTANKGRYSWPCPERDPPWADAPRPAEPADLFAGLEPGDGA